MIKTKEVFMTDVDASAASEPVEGKKKRAKKPVVEGEAKPKREKRARYPDDHVITVMVPNPKHGACAARFEAYRTGMTIKEYTDILSKEPFNRSMGLNWADIWWDTDPKRNFIHVGPTTVDVPPPPPPKEKKPRKKKADLAVIEGGTQPPAA
jgi:hypothetical protein